MAKQSHPYHLVDPSPWPFVASMSILALAFGAAMSMHDKPYGLGVLGLGFAGVLYIMYVWWRDVFKEAREDKAHNPVVQLGLRAGMALFIVSEVMFFAAFFWAFFNASVYPLLPVEEVWAFGEGIWPPAGIETFDAWSLPFLNTLILLLSGTTVTWAHHALVHGKYDEVKQALWITVLLGISFTALQAFEYGHAAFGFTEGVYASNFYMATGFHGVHVIIGTLFLAVNLQRSIAGKLDKDNHLSFEFAAWYWHFVDVVWLFLFIFVYWWGGA